MSRWLSRIGALAQWIGAPLAMIGLLGVLLTDLAAWWEKGYWASKPISVLLGHNAEKIQAAGRAIEGAPLWIGLGIAAVCLFLVGRWLENRFADTH